MQGKPAKSLAWRIFHGATVVAGSLGLTALFFLVLPVVQAIAEGGAADTLLQSVDTASLPPPPPIAEEEPEPEPEEEEPPPELQQDLPPLDLAQLDLALNAGSAEGWGTTLAFDLNLATASGAGGDSPFSLADLDQEPRAVSQTNPLLDSKLRKRTPASVDVVFVVDEEGRVRDAKAWRSSDAAFERTAVAAVSQWRFEPGTRGGKPVQSRMRVTVTFPESR